MLRDEVTLVEVMAQQAAKSVEVRLLNEVRLLRADIKTLKAQLDELTEAKKAKTK